MARVANRKGAVAARPTAQVTCAFCKGKGKDPWGLMSVMAACQVCKGQGTVRVEKPYKQCLVCHGTGVQYNRRLNCLACGGKGVLPVHQGMKRCPECEGSGRGAFGLYCLRCKGKGIV